MPVVLPNQVIKPRFLQKLISVNPVEQQVEAHECPAGYEGEYQAIEREEILKKSLKQWLSLKNGFFIAVNVEVERQAVNYWVDFEVYAETVDEPSRNVVLFKQKIHSQVDQQRDDIVIGAARTHEYRNWVEDPERDVEEGVFCIDVLGLNEPPHDNGHHEIKEAESNLACQGMHHIVEQANVGGNGRVPVRVPLVRRPTIKNMRRRIREHKVVLICVLSVRRCRIHIVAHVYENEAHQERDGEEQHFESW